VSLIRGQRLHYLFVEKLNFLKLTVLTFHCGNTACIMHPTPARNESIISIRVLSRQTLITYSLTSFPGHRFFFIYSCENPAKCINSKHFLLDMPFHFSHIFESLEKEKRLGK
jgi:hypothetical protein